MKKFIALFAVVITSLNSGLVLADCNKQQSCNAAVSRFILNKGEAFDKVTQLTWSRCSVGATWKEGVGCIGSSKLMTFEEKGGLFPITVKIKNTCTNEIIAQYLDSWSN